ncbi:MAG: ABC transporter permease [Emergencia sp.]|jgi:peptide/nickel transport system permease protein|uniref:ABC transporter permease n=1 Tax=Anaerotruncus colihominis TaxID=169435 RepID=A0A845QJF4_9FIRM|nr:MULTISPECIES: ABC transporter permease [Eubacteriales]MCI9475928.1 ABC transporter permease [Emergencia sp.]NBH61231.1 ABC transporter permease [Anaerotruncus colihominis]NCF01886.1 ABC transporter permease [Anaerotruncus sp. 80]
MNKKTSKKNSQVKEIWRRFKKSKTAMLGLVLLVFILLIAIFADLIVPYQEAITQDPANRLQGPSAEHWFGTDEIGRDLFARIVHGSRYSLLIGISTSIFALLIGGLLGAAAGYYGKTVDNVIMRLVDVVMTVPPILLSLAVVAALGANLRNLLIAITISCVPSMVRMVRSVVLTVIDNDYIEAARSYGGSDLRIILKYVIPNALGPIIVTTTMNVSSMILSASGLSFLGMGVQPPAPEWGALLSDARQYMFNAPYLLYIPGIFIVLAALCFNLAGDGLRDALDPKLKD